MKKDILGLSVDAWQLNAARVLDKLLDLVVEAGGDIASIWEPWEGTEYRVLDKFFPGTRVLNLKALSSATFVLNRTYIRVTLGPNPLSDCFFQKQSGITDNLISSGMSSTQLEFANWWCAPRKSEYEYLSDEEVLASAQQLLEYLQREDDSIAFFEKKTLLHIITKGKKSK